MESFFISDIDECLEEPCHAFADCENTNGSYTCTCRSGYSGDGLQCEGTCTFIVDTSKDKYSINIIMINLIAEHNKI